MPCINPTAHLCSCRCSGTVMEQASWATGSGGVSWLAGQVEDRLRERARLQYSAATVRQVASTAKVAAQRTRAALAALDLAGAMKRSVQTAQQLRGPQMPLAPQ